jgi:hypothetical protein
MQCLGGLMLPAGSLESLRAPYNGDPAASRLSPTRRVGMKWCHEAEAFPGSGAISPRQMRHDQRVSEHHSVAIRCGLVRRANIIQDTPPPIRRELRHLLEDWSLEFFALLIREVDHFHHQEQALYANEFGTDFRNLNHF